MFRQWSPEITLFLNDTVEPTEEEWDKLAARSIRVVEGAVASVVTNLMAQVITAAAEGVMAGARINADLIEEETRWAVEGRFGPFSASSEAAVSKIVLGERRHGLTR